MDEVRVLVSGPKGCGKTAVCMMLARSLHQAGLSFGVINPDDLLFDESPYPEGFRHTSVEEAIKAMKSTSFVLIVEEKVENTKVDDQKSLN